jgi:CDP-paratose 2-epimerase
VSRPRALVTGGAGFIGSNLADRLAREDADVVVFDNLSRDGAAANAAWLQRRHPRRISMVTADIRDADGVAAASRDASVVFHLAAQVAVTTSLTAPLADFEVNVRGTLLLLEALRARAERVPLVFASTNKVYGSLADIPLALQDERWQPRDELLRRRGIDERRSISFHTPYGCSKGAADQYVLDWSRSFGVPTVVLRMSCIYGTRQRGTEDQGWVAHFLLRAIAGQPITIYGDGRQVRDVLFVDDAADAYVGAWRAMPSVAGRAFNLGGGAENAVSLREVIGRIEAMRGRGIDVSYADWRPGDQKWFVADASAVRRDLRLAAPIRWRDGLARLAASYATDRVDVVEAAR